MKLPADWDEPSPDNKAICDQFGYGTFDYSGMLPYRIFVPDSGERVPLIVYLHGADAYGKDNELHLTMHDIGTVFARNDWQSEHPCFVLAPQCSVGRHWAGFLDGNRVCALVKKVMDQYDNIDPNRLYIYGYSAGGVGCLGIIKYHPEMFAGAVSICGATGREDLKALIRTPVWLIHAADDQIVKASYKAGSGYGVHLGSRDIYEELKEVHPDLHYTEYKSGSLKESYGINPHCSWVPAGHENEVKDWLFSKTK
jgi:predicted peptidase